LGIRRAVLVTTLYYFWAGAVPLATWLSRPGTAGGAPCTTLGRVATRYVFALVPLGFGMWIAHYSFHLWIPMHDRATRSVLSAIWPERAGPIPVARAVARVAPWIPQFEIMCSTARCFVSSGSRADRATGRGQLFKDTAPVRADISKCGIHGATGATGPLPTGDPQHAQAQIADKTLRGRPIVP